ncbi:MAG: family 2 glycosyl transferase [Microgenomates group bacterium Gr01-1014_16]|nr:MAG: family 2 glycosyl transferase [Microgenomates group bacterium Gr01-1014_16]
MLSVIIITKNEEEMIGDCLISVKDLADEIIVVDSGNTDKTNEIAKSFGAKIIKTKSTNYSEFRNAGLKAATGDWILYVDADERVSPQLRLEIKNTTVPGVYQIPRKNIYLGKEMRFGGWGNDKVIRLFYKKFLKEYQGELHEQPIFDGQLRTMNHELIHHSHRDLSSMLEKTLDFIEYEAKLRVEVNHPPIVWWRFLRVMATEFWLRFVKLQAWRDGPRGVIDGIFQIFNMFVIYARLWEMQHEKGFTRR